ncbi:sucrase/ferredoxin domain-containing protein [Biscogniauxia mediterranea]|nr:sucrase/ferredoxin domain-containing protein [Biscogniauxia mediterranea]
MATAGIVFRIVYTCIYVLLCLVLAALLLVVPGDFVRQALATTRQLINVIVIAIVYVLTLLIVLFVYALRLYVTRTVLASIPKTWIPTEKGDVTKEVWKMIATSLGRSAAIAWEARPKVIAPEVLHPIAEEVSEEAKASGTHAKEGRKSLQLFRTKAPATVEDEMGIALPTVRPVWGEIEHPGWGSPASVDLANLQYSTVLSELPNLIEAKAVSQAPADIKPGAAPPTLNADAVALLQRGLNMSMRDYISHLISLQVLPSSEDVSEFLDTYERARFSTRPMSNATFRQLMHLFAELLRSMQPLDTSVIYGYPDPGSSYADSDGHIDDDAPLDTTPTTPTRSISSSFSVSRSSTRSRARRPKLPARNSSTSTWHQYRTAPTTPRSKVGGGAISRTPSSHSTRSFAHIRRPYPISQPSSSSLSLSQGSVIRLATREDSGGLPYVLRLSDTL